MSTQPTGIVQGTIAPHIAAEIYRQLGDVDGRTRVVVVQAPADAAHRPASAYLGPVVLVLTAGIGLAGLIAFLLAVASMAAAVLPTVGGITLSVSLARRSRKGK